MQVRKRNSLVYIKQKTAPIGHTISPSDAGIRLTAMLCIICMTVFGYAFFPPHNNPGMIEAKASAVAEGKGITELDLENGIYTIEVASEGGLIGTQAVSPQRMQIKDGTMTALVEWENEYYQYMVVDGVKYLPEKREGNSKFKIPVKRTDTDIPVTVCRNDLGVAAEAQCVLHYDSATIQKAASRVNPRTAMATAGFSFLGIMGLASIVLVFLHRRMKEYVG